MWDEFPSDLKRIVLDYYGHGSIDLHRNALFVHAELYGFRLLCNKVGCPLEPSIIAAVRGLKQYLKLAYLHPEMETLFKNHGGRLIP